MVSWYEAMGEKYVQGYAYVIENEDELRDQHGSDYIAVFGRDVIDSDKDLGVLCKRLHDAGERGPLLINTIDKIIDPPIFIGLVA